jgi:glyoxylase-like metal-dependent hydrolase (beta-lactamase superfamily II)
MGVSQMRHIAPDVYLLEGLRGSNIYFLNSKDGYTLIDSGLPNQTNRIAAQLHEAGYALSQLRSLVLTHGHGDHVGSAAELAHRSGAQVMAHRQDIPYIEQTQPLPFSSWLKHLMLRFADRVLFRQPPCRVDKPLEEGDVIEAAGGLRVIHTPGHTPGSICLYQPERELLFCGDTIINMNPMTGKERLRPSPAMISVDSSQARESLGKLAGLSLEVLCFGHGSPILGGAGKQIEALLRKIPASTGQDSAL